MIARVYSSEVSTWLPQTEASFRQCGQFAAYGAEHDFLRFYQDDNGNCLSIMENSAVLDVNGDVEEMCLFLSMNPEIRYVRTNRDTAQILAKKWQVPFRSEAVMQAPCDCGISPFAKEMKPRDIYPVIANGFDEGVPPFDSWYADVHHRYRRQLCTCIGVCEEEKPVACAMTVARCSGAALIGAVATLPQARGKGYASACVTTLAAKLQHQGCRVLLSPKNEYAHRLYLKLGFSVVGEWGSVERSDK